MNNPKILPAVVRAFTQDIDPDPTPIETIRAIQDAKSCWVKNQSHEPPYAPNGMVVKAVYENTSAAVMMLMSGGYTRYEDGSVYLNDADNHETAWLWSEVAYYFVLPEIGG